jgi:hypothetical protein
VLVTSATLDFPGDRAKAPKVKDARQSEPVWEGALLTSFTEPRFPPARPADDR